MNDDIKKAIEVLKNGGTILYPTDTVWGIGCDATNEKAVSKIYALKKRDDNKSMLVLVDHIDKLSLYLRQVPDLADDLISMSNKPLTIIYPGAVNLAQNLIADDGSIGIRVTSDEFCQKLISRFKKPIISTSANISNMPAPSIFVEISDEIKKSVDYVVGWRQDDTHKTKPSGIIKLGLNGEIKIIRE